MYDQRGGVDRGGSVEFVTVKGGVERGPNPAGANQPQDGGLAKVDVNAVHAKSHKPWNNLRLHAVVDPLQPLGSGGPDCLGLGLVHAFNVLSQKLGQKTDGGE